VIFSFIIELRLPFWLALDKDFGDIQIRDLSIVVEDSIKHRGPIRVIVKGQCEFIFEGPMDVYHLRDMIVSEIGDTIDELCSALVKPVSSNYHVYNGDDFTCLYNIIINDDQGAPIWQEGYGALPLINRQSFDGKMAKPEMQPIEEALMDSAIEFLEQGLYDLAIIIGYTALEVFMTNFIGSKFKENTIKAKMFKQIKSEQALINKYFDYGPSIIYERSLSLEWPETYSTILELKRLRDSVAHSGTALNGKELRDLSTKERYEKVEDYLDEADDAIRWLKTLDSPYRTGEIVRIIVEGKSLSNNELGIIVSIKPLKGNKGWNYYVLDHEKRRSSYYDINEFKSTNEYIDQSWFESE